MKLGFTVSLFEDNRYHYTNINFLIRVIRNLIYFKKKTVGIFNLPYGATLSRYQFIKNYLIKSKKIKYIKKIKNISIKQSKIRLPKNLYLKTRLFKKYKHLIK